MALSILREGRRAVYQVYILAKSTSHFQSRFISEEKSYLDDLEKTANSNPHDPYRQYDFLSQVLENDPKFVQRRVDSGRYAMNKDVMDLYDRALVISGVRADNSQQQEQSDSQKRSSRLKYIQSYNTLLSMILIPGIFIYMVIKMIVNVGPKDLLGSVDFSADIPDNTFDDVAGNNVAKRKMQELVSFLRDPESFQMMGCKAPKGVLLSGPPGVGKTLLAKCLAGEANVPFFFASGSEFDQMFVGLGARRIRQLFSAARKQAPAIIFIDEIDTVGMKRGMGGGSRMSVNQLLSEMDGFEEYCGVIVVAATNDPEVLDEALVREGRFDVKVSMSLPCTRDRAEILKVHTRKRPLSDEADLDKVARATVGMSGAQLATMVNLAGLRAVNKDKTVIDNDDLEYARAKVLLGGVNTSIAITDSDMKKIAGHQAGLAIMAILREEVIDNNIYLASVEPRISITGAVHCIPNRDMHSITNEQLIAMIDSQLGGRVADTIMGGGDNAIVATMIDQQMGKVNRYAKTLIEDNGYSKKQGFVRYSDSKLQNINTTSVIQEEIKNLLAERLEVVTRELTTHKTQLIKMRDTLIEYKSLTGDECKTVFRGRRLARKPEEGLPSSD